MSDEIPTTHGLVKRLAVADHPVKLFPGLLGLGDAELLDLFELVDTEDTPGVLAVRTSLFPEAGGNARVPAFQ